MLKQQREETQLPWQHQPAPPAAPTSAGRFDKHALQEILATAAHLQQAEQDTLSQTEVENIAAEMGLAPQHVRQAIVLSGQRTAKVYHLPYAGSSARQKRLVIAVTLVYSVLTLLTGCAVEATTRDHNSGWNGIAYLLYFLTLFTLPVTIFWLGTQLRYKRAGAVAGGLVMLVMYLSALIPALVSGLLGQLEPYMVWNGVMIGCAYVSSGIVFGLGGAALHQWLASRRLRSVLPVAKPSDSDR